MPRAAVRLNHPAISNGKPPRLLSAAIGRLKWPDFVRDAARPVDQRGICSSITDAIAPASWSS